MCWGWPGLSPRSRCTVSAAGSRSSAAATRSPSCAAISPLRSAGRKAAPTGCARWRRAGSCRRRTGISTPLPSAIAPRRALVTGSRPRTAGRCGAKLAIVGDTAQAEALVEAVRGADLLVVEATFLARDAALARERRHITAAEAARLARAAGVGALVLNHISGRYPAAEIAAEAAAIFAETRVAADFDRILVTARPPRRAG